MPTDPEGLPHRAKRRSGAEPASRRLEDVAAKIIECNLPAKPAPETKAERESRLRMSEADAEHKRQEEARASAHARELAARRGAGAMVALGIVLSVSACVALVPGYSDDYRKAGLAAVVSIGLAVGGYFVGKSSADPK